MTTPELSVADEKDRASADSRPAPVQSWPRLRFASFCYIQASTSALDWVLGPLFPSIQAHYGIVYRVAALLLITQFIGASTLSRTVLSSSGALLAFPLNFLLGARLGVARMTIVGAVLMLLGSVVACFDVPFAVLALAYACYSLGQVVTRVQTDSRAVSCVSVNKPALTLQPRRYQVARTNQRPARQQRDDGWRDGGCWHGDDQRWPALSAILHRRQRPALAQSARLPACRSAPCRGL